MSIIQNEINVEPNWCLKNNWCVHETEAIVEKTTLGNYGEEVKMEVYGQFIVPMVLFQALDIEYAIVRVIGGVKFSLTASSTSYSVRYK